MDEETMFKVAEGLGLGVGCMEGTCGAVTGACLLAGCKNSTGNLDKPNSKASTYKLSREIMQKFKEKNQGPKRSPNLKITDCFERSQSQIEQL